MAMSGLWEYEGLEQRLGTEMSSINGAEEIPMYCTVQYTDPTPPSVEWSERIIGDSN
jgi:hypothetical protein